MPTLLLLTLSLEPEPTIIATATSRPLAFGWLPAELTGRRLLSLCPSRQPDGSDSAARLQQVLAQAPGEVAWRFSAADGTAHDCRLELLGPAPGLPDTVQVGVLGAGTAEVGHELAALRNHLLEMVATGSPLPQVLERLTALMESEFDDLVCTVLLLDLDGRVIESAIGPSMPPGYLAALRGYTIGPMVGSCGTAMFTGKKVIVSDIETDPLWEPYKGLVLPHGFRACWSSPIRAARGTVIGSFAMYYRSKKRPSERELGALQLASHLAGIAIDQAGRDDERRRHAEWLEAEVRSRSEALVEAQNALTGYRKLAALGHLVAGLSHEMNTPLGNAQLATGLLEESLAGLLQRMHSGTPLRRQELEAALTRGQEAGGIIAQSVERTFKLMARLRLLTDGAAQGVRAEFALADAVTQAWRSVGGDRAQPPVRLIAEGCDAVSVDGYREATLQVLSQLFDNALRHGFAPAGRPAEPTVRVSADVDSRGELRIAVSDNGTGMSAAALEHAFEPFFTTTFGQGGGGLGLFLVHNLVTGILTGSIRLDSDAGRGTIATLTLPPLQAPCADDATACASRRSA